jgi:hypothetical protein
MFSRFQICPKMFHVLCHLKGKFQGYRAMLTFLQLADIPSFHSMQLMHEKASIITILVNAESFLAFC